MSFRDAYDCGLDILGADMNVSSFMPWMGLVGGALQGIGGALTGGTGGAAKGAVSADDVKKAVADAEKKAKQQAALDKAKADASRARTIEFATLGVVGVAALVGTMFLLARKKK